MKKIVAVVLALVMVMGLATTAFAAADAYDLYLADDTMKTEMKAGTPADTVTIDAVAAKTNKDGSGAVAYLSINDGAAFAVKTSAPTVSDYAVCEKGKTAVLYYVTMVAGDETSFAYEAAVKATADFGKKCGQFDFEPEVGAKYFVVKGELMKAGDPNGDNYLLDGKVVGAESTGEFALDHTFTVAANKYDETLKAVVPTTARCTNAFCGMESKAIYLDGKAPAESTVYALDGTYVVALGAAATTPAEGDKVESAQTFDAGIAMYVGMSVMAAAGSAVVLKKKD